jgi:diguanylate cyclase
VVACVAVAMPLVWVTMRWGGSTTAVAVNDLWALAAAAWASAECLRRARRSPSARAGWYWLAAAAALWALGEMLWSVWELVLVTEVPFPSVADVAYLAAVPCALAGLVCLSEGVGREHRFRALLDGGLIGVAVLFAGWALVLGAAWQGDGPLLAHAINIAYPVTDVAMMAVALLSLLWAKTRHRRALCLLAGAFTMMGIADMAFTWLVDNGSYTSSSQLGVVWIASYVMVALAARLPDPDREPNDHITSIGAVLLPYVPFGVAAIVVAPRLFDGRPLEPFLAINGALLLMLALARQTMMALDLRRTVVTLSERDHELARLALHDGLTGLPNRAQFVQRLKSIVARPGAHPSVVYIDVDGFKEINDRHGHAYGDFVLIEASRRLRACTRPAMLLARLGGDEFVVIVESGVDEAVELARAALDSFAAHFRLDGEVIWFQASIGVAAWAPGIEPQEVVRRADAAMYVAKSTGKARAVLYPDRELAVAADAHLTQANNSESVCRDVRH